MSECSDKLCKDIFGWRHYVGILFEIFLYIFLVLEYCVYTVNDARLLVYARTAILVLAAVLGILLFVSGRIPLKLVAYVLIMIASYILCWFMTRSGEYYYGWDFMKYTVCYVGVALGLLSHKYKLLPAMLLYYAVAIHVLVRIAIMGADIRTFMLSDSSYNFIPVIVMLYLMIYLIVRHQNGKSISVLAAIVFFAVTLVSYGRSSIVAGAVLVVLAIIKNYTIAKKRWHRAVLICLTIAIIAMSCYALSDSSIVSSVFGKFVSRGVDNSERLYIWSTYLKECFNNIRYLIFGGDIYLIRSDGNLHNCLLQTHASFGIIFFILNIWLIIKLIIKGIRNKDLAIPFMLVVFLVKGSFDKLLFHCYTEIVFFYFMFYYFKNYSRSREIVFTTH